MKKRRLLRLNPSSLCIHVADKYGECGCTADNSSDKIMLTESLSLARDILNYINRQVDEHEKEQRLFTMYNKLDARSYTLVNGSKFKVSSASPFITAVTVTNYSTKRFK